MPINLDHLPSNIRDRINLLSADIDLTAEIIKGGNGYVFVGRNRYLARDVAIKFYYWGDGVHVEPGRLAELASDHVLVVHDAASVDADWAYFITPYCGNGDLDDCFSSIQYGPVEAIDVVLQIAAGVSYLHSRGFVHRDLKPSNIFVMSEMNFVIGDFGSVVILGNDGYAETQSNHSLIYRPPEDFVERPFCRFYRQGDIYQLGILLFQTLGGRLPYEERSWLTARQAREYDQLSGPDQQFFAREIIRGKIEAGTILSFDSLPAWVPPRLRRVIRTACHVDRNLRHATVADLIGALNNVRIRLRDWRIVDGHPTLRSGAREYRIVEDRDRIRVEMRVLAGWRSHNRMRTASLREAIESVEAASRL